ncbi:hypothetical protein MKW94_004806, partial [Papaver nudicaule]|nr:hypothetical protein [Papaver nudicaule]
MASMKAERPVGSQQSGSLKKEPAKAAAGTNKAPSSSKSAPKKAETKPREPKKK